MIKIQTQPKSALELLKERFLSEEYQDRQKRLESAKTATGISVEIQSLNDSPIPQYSTSGSCGLDLRANIKHAATVRKGQRVLVPLGIKIAVPQGYGAFVIPRSGLALKHGITITNTPGLIDSDYRGEINAIIENLNDLSFIIEPEMRIAQMVIIELPKVHFIEVEELESTDRGENGFGSTGI